MATGKQALEKLAELAAEETHSQVSFSSQNDQAFSLRVSAVHPLQILENVHQDQVRKAIADLGDEATPDDEQEAEKTALAKYFLFTPSEPRLVDLAPDVEEETIYTQLVDAAKSMKLVKAVLNTGPADDEAEKLASAKTTLEEIRVKLVAVNQEFNDDGGKVGWLNDAENILEGEDANDKTLQTRITEADTWDKVKTEYNHLDKALDYLEESAGGLARVTMLYGISPFFLFRLLVQYKIEGADITDKKRRDVSSEVTEHLNKQEWVRDWLAKQMETIAANLSGEENVFFHLKGGRALALMLDIEGENDWDTSVVINPTLPEVEWYALYNKVHDVLLKLLRTAKIEFLLLASDNANEFKIYCETEIAADDDDPDEADDDDDADAEDLDDFAEVDKASAKAELIDIGIPRRDTIEALEQWHRTKNSIQAVAKYGATIPIPGPLYYIEEYIVMVREALSNRSPSLHKTAKRIQRLANVLASENIDATIGGVKNLISVNVVPNGLALLDNKDGRAQRIVTVLLEQFSHGYALRELAGLASAVDEKFAEDGQAPTYDDYPERVTSGKADYLEDGAKQNTWNNTECDAILQHIAFAQTLSIKVEKHLRTRAEYFGFIETKGDTEADARRKKIAELAKALYTGSIFKPEFRFQVQLAVVGSYAAYLHADYSKSFNDKIGKLDPVTMIELRYYCHPTEVGLSEQEVLDMFAKVPFQTYVTNDDDFSTDDITGLAVQDAPEDSEVQANAIYLAWHEEVDFGDDFKYKPVILKLSVKKEWPEVSFVWGCPVLSLNDLIRDYTETAALSEEFETHYRLRGTAEILKEMMTHYI